uniref:Uncharacterized protein n=1 Tax=Schistocephalus solidus TaxID=70667 RepID=A0A0X3PUH3_SCHSO
MNVGLFVIFPIVLLRLPLVLTGEPTITLSPVERVRRQYDGPPAFFAPGGVNADHELQAPLMIDLLHNLTSVNGPKGRCGICARRYRVLQDLRYKASEECRRYSNSRQASLGDITEFYHTLFNSRRQESTITFLLADSFPEFTLSVSLMQGVTTANPPHLMIEAANRADQAVCVESIRCPEPLTTTSSAPRLSEMTKAPDGPSQTPQVELKRSDGELKSSSAATEKKPTSFWEAVIENSSPRLWVIATLVLSVLCLLLFTALLCTCFWICNLKRQYRRKRCRGTCRFGCKCPPDVIRQAATDAAVCGPLGSGLGTMPNGSVLGYPSVGRSWAVPLNGKIPVNPLYVSLGANEKLLSVQDSGTPPPPPSAQMLPFQGSAAGSATGSGQNWTQYQTSIPKGKRLNQDAMWCSHSDGSSLSEHTMASGVGSGPGAMRSQPSRSSGQPTGFPFNASSANTSTCLQSYCQGDGEAIQATNAGLLHSGSPARFEDFKGEPTAMTMSAMRNGSMSAFERSGIGAHPVDMRGLNADTYDQTREAGATFAHANETANITPPAAFFDATAASPIPTGAVTSNSKNIRPLDGVDSKLNHLDQSWTFGSENAGNLSRNTFTSTYQNHPLGGIKVLPTGGFYGGKQAPSSVEFKRRDGYLNGISIEESATRRTTGLTSRLLTHPLTEDVEQIYGYDNPGGTPLHGLSNNLVP